MEHPISDDIKRAKERLKAPQPARLVSRVESDGTMIEMLFDPERKRTTFCVGNDGQWQILEEIALDGRRFRPYSSDNNLIQHGVVLFPSYPQEYDSEDLLAEEIKAYIHSYVDVSPVFEDLATYYVLLSWVYDAFAELPYLRVRGDYGSGKTRFLLVVGSICYKPIFASGASTVSPLFRMLDSIGGTLILDESDYRASDEKAEMTKILNNGNVRGFPVLRSEVQPNGEFNPTAYSVFGPKIVASRGWFEDRALESRFLTEEMGRRGLRPGIPLNLDDDYKAAALQLRNKLLTFRLRRRGACRIDPSLHDPSVESRLNQIFAPLLAIVRQPALVDRFRHLAREYQELLTQERSEDIESKVLQIIRQLLEIGERLSIKTITDRLIQEQAYETFEQVTPKFVGSLIRRRLRLRTKKQHGSYVIGEGQSTQLHFLFEKFGLGLDSKNEQAAGEPPPTLPV